MWVAAAAFSPTPSPRRVFEAVGVDLSEESLEVARRHGSKGKIHYQKADAYHLPFGEAEFDAVCTMDFLEHVERPEEVIAEAWRVLKRGGPFFFHTFNRNFLSRVFAIHGVRWFVRNTPKNFHVYPLFIRPMN
jgi:2-polyprenyl-6-hydroxyphenyl methylase/3-demethylubiquinone-9 3-methyltransferase